MRKAVLLAALISILAFGGVVSAQGGDVVITLKVPSFVRNNFNEDVLREFEAQTPGVKVALSRSSEEAFMPSPANSVEDYLDAVQAYAGAGDVLYVNSSTITPEATRAGYFLDLSPLTAGDPTLNVEDFYPAAWQSYQWDRGVWALPVSLNVTALIYNPAAFDEAGLAYPNPNWTMDDLANAIRALAQVGPDGTVVTPGFAAFGDTSLLFRSLLGEGFYDSTTIPESPRLSSPALETLLTTWADLQSEGLNTLPAGGLAVEIDAIPLRIGDAFGIGLGFGPNQDRPDFAGALLPGGKAGVTADAFAVSGGTQYPEQAYALAKFLTTHSEVATFFGITPARRSLEGVQVEGGGILSILNNLLPEGRAFVQDALANALPASELRYGDYINVALQKMAAEGVDAQTALRDVEAQAVTALQTAANRRSTTVIAVATPIPTPVLGAGEIALNFGLSSFVSPLPNQADWDRLIQEFVAGDPQVGQIVLDAAFGGGFGGGALDNMASRYDCFYLPNNAVQSGDLTTVLSLDPFMDADPTFDRSDVLGNVLAQVQSAGKTWAFPISIQPQILRYNSELFAQAGVNPPTDGWTIDAFVDALRALKTSPDDPAPFVSRDFGSNYLLMLIAAYGGVPLDYRTNPVTVNFTDPTTVEAIRQVLDLAKQGYIAYQELAGFRAVSVFIGENTDPIYTDSLNAFSFGGGPGGGTAFVIGISGGGGAFSGPQGDSDNPYRMTTYPSGSQRHVVSYDVSTAYISAQSQNPDACYRWISFVARHPELFSSMPARRSLIDDPAFVAAENPETIAFYNLIARQLQDPNTIAFPSQFGGLANVGGFVIQFWLNRAFDNYVLQDADLDAELVQAQQYAVAYQQCIAGIPPFDPASQASLEGATQYFQQLQQCAVKADPSIASLLPGS